MCEYFSHFDGRKRRLILKFRAQTKCVRPNKAVTCQLQTQSSHERGEMCVCVCVEYLHNLDAERCQAQHFYHTYMYVYKRYMYLYIYKYKYTCFGAWLGLFDACQKLARKPFEWHSPTYVFTYSLTHSLGYSLGH